MVYLYSVGIDEEKKNNHKISVILKAEVAWKHIPSQCSAIKAVSAAAADS